MPTHGSLSKAGKVRERNPVQWDLRKRKSKEGKRLFHVSPHKPPRLSLRVKFRRRVLLKQRAGQRWVRGKR